jgi:hypothetical protein
MEIQPARREIYLINIEYSVAMMMMMMYVQRMKNTQQK